MALARLVQHPQLMQFWSWIGAGQARDGPRLRGLRSHLVALVLLAVLPVLGISTLAVGNAVLEYRSSFRDRLQDNAAALALALDRDIEIAADALAQLAASPDLEPGGDLALFDAAARRLGGRVVLRGPDGAQVLDTSRPASPHPPAPSPPIPRATAQPLAASLFTDAPAGDQRAPMVWVSLPVLRRGAVLGALAMSLAPARIAALPIRRNGSGDTVVVLADGKLTPVGWWPDGAAAAVEDLPLSLGRAVPPGRMEGVGQGSWNDGTERVFGFARPRRSPDWLVVVSEPLSAYQANWRGPLLTQSVAALAPLLLAGLAAASLGLFLTRQLSALTGFARVLALAELVPEPMPRSTVTEFEALRMSLSRADVVLRRRAAAEKMALREARVGQELLASVVNGTAEGICVKDLDGRYVLVNRAMLLGSALGLEEWRVLGRQVADVLPGDLARTVERADREVLERPGDTHAFDIGLTAPDGVARTFSLTKTAWWDAEGTLAGVVTVAHDVTDQRNAEIRLRTVQAELLRATRLSAMGAMASGLAHELNQPLAAATNFLNAAARMLDPGAAPPEASQPGPSPPAREVVGEAAQQLLRAGAIVRRLRDFVGRGEAELQSEDVALLIDEACNLARSDEAVAGCSLSVQVGAPGVAPPGVALVDRTQIQQVLLNLIRNAAEAMAGLPVREITVAALRTPGGSVEITVSDTGPGLAAGLHDRLFEPFVSTKVNGMGIGLAICRTIVEGHGGRLAAEQRTVGGMLFRVVLPPVKPSGAIDA